MWRLCQWVPHLVSDNYSKYKTRDGTTNFSRVCLPRAQLEITFLSHVAKDFPLPFVSRWQERLSLSTTTSWATVCPFLWLLLSQPWHWLLAASPEPTLGCLTVPVGKMHHPMTPDPVQFAQVISLVQSLMSLCIPEKVPWSQMSQWLLEGEGHLKGTHQQDGIIHSESRRTDTLSQHLSFNSQVTQGYV